MGNELIEMVDRQIQAVEKGQTVIIYEDAQLLYQLLGGKGAIHEGSIENYLYTLSLLILKRVLENE